MSLTVEVIRGLGDNPGHDLTCIIFSDEVTFRQVGRVAIDQSTQGLKLVTITLPGIRAHVRRGEIISILDGGREYRAKIKSVLYSVGRDDSGVPFATCSMSLRMMEIL